MKLPDDSGTKLLLNKDNVEEKKQNKNSKLSFSFIFFFIYEVFVIDSETIKISTKLGMHLGYNPGSVIGYVKLTYVKPDGHEV